MGNLGRNEHASNLVAKYPLFPIPDTQIASFCGLRVSAFGQERSFVNGLDCLGQRILRSQLSPRTGQKMLRSRRVQISEGAFSEKEALKGMARDAIRLSRMKDTTSRTS
jgi:hypothetical protein